MLKNNILNKFDKSEWFDFSNGLKISKETVNSWIEEGIEFLENNKDREFYKGLRLKNLCFSIVG